MSFLSAPLYAGVSRYADLLGFLGVANSPSVIARQVRVVGTSFNQGQPGSVTIDIDSQGDENAIGFSLTFDTSKLSYASAAKGSDATTATLNVNTLQLASGHLGLAVAFPSEVTFAAGTRQMVVVTFNVAPTATGTTGIGFGDQPIFRETADISANVLPTDYPLTPTQFPINLPPNPVPTLGGVTPNSATAGSSGFNLNISGSNFISGSIAKFNGTDLVTSLVSSTQLTAQLPTAAIGTAGNASVTVFNPAPGGGTSSALNFTINNPAPVITNLTPASATAAGGAFVLTIDGSNFVDGSVAKFNGSDRTTGFLGSTQLAVQITAADLATAGVFPITVQNAGPGGGSSGILNFTVNNPIPTLSSLAPTSATVGGAAFALTVNGTNFVDGSVVKINGNNRATTFVNSTQVTAQILATDIATVGSLAITVQNPAPGGGTSSGLSLSVNNPVPVVSSLSPASVTAGGPAFTLTVNGNNFINTSVVRLNGTNRTTSFVGSTQLTAQLTAADIAGVGALSITVFSPTPGGGTSSALNLNVNNPAPIVSSLSPTSAVAGDPAFTLTVNGSNFVNGAVVKFNGNDRATSFGSGAQLTAQITAADVAAAGTFAVVVVNPAPGGGTSSAVNFTVNNPAPTLSSLAPTSATVGGAALSLTVIGNNFVNGSVVKFNGSDRTTSLVSSSLMTAQLTVADLTTAGVFAVTVQTAGPGGGTSSGLNFTVNNPAATLSSLAPTSATVGGAAFTLTVNGSNFVNGAVVKFNGSDRTTNFVSGSQLSAQITAADIQATGTGSITVANPGPGGGTSSALNFDVVNPLPALSSLSPASVTAGGPAFTLTVNGSNFVNTCVVRLNDSDRTTSFVSGSQLTAQLTGADIAGAGTLSITVVSPAPGGGTSSTLNLNVNNPAPTLSTLSPSSAIAGDSAFTLTVNGSNFVSGAVVRWNGSDRVTNFVSSSQLTAQTSAADTSAAGTFPITVRNPSPGGGVSNAVGLTVTNPTPELSGMSPTSVTAGSAGFTLSMTGAGFVAGSVVRLNGSDHPTTFVDTTRLTAQVNAADISSAGTIFVSVFSPLPGGGTSGSLNLTVDPAQPDARALRIIGVTTTAGYDVIVPIQLVSQGNENALGFSLLFNPTQLTFVSAALGVDASTASLIVNGTAASGFVGIAVSQPAGTTFFAGVKQIVNVTFNVPLGMNPGSSAITFDDFPIFREVVNINAAPLPTAYSSGEVTIAQSYEADVSPQPQGNHDGTVTVQDWSQVGRFMALLDSVSLGSEFQRADCAPAATRGDGRLSVADWAQAGRYAALLDPVQIAGGPTGPVVQMSPATASKVDEGLPASVVRISMGLARYGQRTAVSVDLQAQGNENAIGFSLMFDPAVVTFISAERGRDAGDSVLQVNRGKSGKGRVGIALALPTERAFDAGRHQIVTLNFVRAGVEGTPTLEFSDLPIDREIVDVRATPLKAAFVREKEEQNNPIDEAQVFVQQQYLDFLGRKPDADGLDYWTAQITQCGADAGCIRNRRISVAAAFFMAQEFQQTGFFIYRLYKGTMGRRPTFQEFMAERSRLMNLSSLELDKQALVQSWLARPEFQGRYPLTLNDEEFVDELLMTVWEGSGVDLSNERQDLIAKISSNGRAHAVDLVMENPAFVRAEYNPAFVLSEYFGYLRRDPDQAGYEFWLNILNSREPNSYHAMVCAFLTSAEYQRRFGSAVTHTNAECGP